MIRVLIIFILGMTNAQLLAQKGENDFKLEMQSLTLALNLKKQLNLSQDIMCQVQLVIYDDMNDFYQRDDLMKNNKPDEVLKQTQNVTLDKIDLLLTEKQKEVFSSIKEFYLMADERTKKTQRFINRLNRQSTQKGIDN